MLPGIADDCRHDQPALLQQPPGTYLERGCAQASGSNLTLDACADRPGETDLNWRSSVGAMILFLEARLQPFDP